MNLAKKLDTWNGVLNKANMKVKRVADSQTAEVYFEVAKYADNNSFICNIVSNIYKKTGVDLRFSFINISSVLFTTKDFSELQNFVENMKFDLIDDGYVYENLTISPYKDNQFHNAAIESLKAHNIDFRVVPNDDLSDIHPVRIFKAFPNSEIVGPGTVLITADDKKCILQSLAKKTITYINTLEK